jgi:hypothetical protein
MEIKKPTEAVQFPVVVYHLGCTFIIDWGFNCRSILLCGHANHRVQKSLLFNQLNPLLIWVSLALRVRTSPATFHEVWRWQKSVNGGDGRDGGGVTLWKAGYGGSVSWTCWPRNMPPETKIGRYRTDKWSVLTRWARDCWIVILLHQRKINSLFRKLENIDSYRVRVQIMSSSQFSCSLIKIHLYSLLIIILSLDRELRKMNNVCCTGNEEGDKSMLRREKSVLWNENST